jgi:hypothetical protein
MSNIGWKSSLGDGPLAPGLRTACGPALRARRSQRLEVFDREDPFAAVIRCTADPAKSDKRTRSKWIRVIRYAVAYKPDFGPLDQFIQRKGGINECATRFSQRLGRKAQGSARAGKSRARAETPH